MWTFKIRSVSSGFTLLEVMVAVAIIAMALVAALGSQSQSVSLATEAKFVTTATFLAQGKIAELEIVAPEDLASDGGDFGDDYPGYRWEYEVGEAALADVGEASDHVKKISLVVYWAEGGRFQYHLDFCRFVPKTE